MTNIREVPGPPAAARTLAAGAVLAAMAYPFLLKAYSAALLAGVLWLAALMLALAFAVPVFGFYVAYRIGRRPAPSCGQVVVWRIALLTIAVPPLYTMLGVMLYMAGDPVPDTTAWLAGWLTVLAVGWRACASPAAIDANGATVSPRLRAAHGGSALAIVVLFLVMHLSNHLAGLLSEAAHRQLMDLFRHVYRARLIEPLIVLLFLFQVASGLELLRRHTLRSADFFRALQIASGAYLVFFILGHMNSVFIYARAFAHIKTDWNFAVGAPTGLMNDAWNIRLLPHYYLGVFLVLSHLALGARVVALAHGARRASADRYTMAGIAASAVVALAIMLGMTGTHFAGG
ncbi:hypothetical protein [Rugamonas sp.]|uniref:hypothetical protein n=1 Tax=Rugamonas sp. TaxID=1926287 RepID=UPI0025D28147|nr:hypothetical protein [Rugamonas sp.]